MTQDEAWLLKEKYHDEKSEAFLNDCNRLKNGEPLAYVIGSIPFLSTTIFLDSHPLIPRTETEFWVEKIIAEMRSKKEMPLRVLDLCAGSGCIGVAVLHTLPMVCVDFGEIDTDHHSTIRKNILENNIDPLRTNIFEGSLFDEITETYDYILSNPPYIDKSLGRVAPEVDTHEPSLALYGGENGLNLIETLIKEAPQHLTPTGVLCLEHEPEQASRIHTLAQGVGFSVISHKDQYGVLRYTHFTRPPLETVSQ